MLFLHVSDLCFKDTVLLFYFTVLVLSQLPPLTMSLIHVSVQAPLQGPLQKPGCMRAHVSYLTYL